MPNYTTIDTISDKVRKTYTKAASDELIDQKEDDVLWSDEGCKNKYVHWLILINMQEHVLGIKTSSKYIYKIKLY